MPPHQNTDHKPWPSAVLWTSAGLLAVIGLALIVRLAQPAHHPGIGEIDVFYWALRTQEFELHGWSHIGTSLWVLPVVMGTLHRLIGGNLYDLFLWAGAIISAILPTLAIFFLTYELSRSRVAGLLAALIYAILPITYYRGVFTVSETLAYVLLPTCLYAAVRLLRRSELWAYGLMLAVFGLAYYTHDSAKLLVLPLAVASIRFFWKNWSRRSTKIALAATVLAGIILVLRDQQLIAGIKFFLFPNTGGNSAFGRFPPMAYQEYQGQFPLLLNLFVLIGAGIYLLRHRTVRWPAVILLAYVLPILFYQQIQPRLSDSTIVPFRLTPFLTFLIVPMAALAFFAWFETISRRSLTRSAFFIFGLSVLVSSTSAASFPLLYITGPQEQSSLLRLPIRPNDFLVTQTGMIGMTALATKTNESNYFGDIGSRILKQQTVSELQSSMRAVDQESNKRLTGVLISKWKLKNRDPQFGWWDSLVNPQASPDLFRQAGYPVRYEDANIILFDRPSS